MKLDEMKAATFKQYTIEEWTIKAEESLKGKRIEDLSTRTYENIVLKPLYTKKDMGTNLSQFPGTSDFRRGMSSAGYPGKGWCVANKLSYENLEELKAKLKAACAAGQNGFAIEVNSNLFSDEAGLEKLLSEYASVIPFSVNAGGFLKPFLKHVANAASGNKNAVSGFIASDLIAEAASKGGFEKDEDESFTDWEQVILHGSESLPKVKTILVNTSNYHNAGANAVQELAIAIATGVFYVQTLLDKGWDIEQALNKMIFHFSVGANFFMETAKLRAARILWDKAMEAYGVSENARKMELSAETSQFTKTIFDPYVNLLRAGNEAFSAVLGGVQYLSVSPLDEAKGHSTAFSERIARNTQLILKAESHLEKVADPAGGSWYIETLTRELAEKAWDLFLEIDSQGGIVETLKSNWLQNAIHEVKEEREKDIFTRKQSMIGTNVYANVSEATEDKPSNHEKEFYTSFQPLAGTRLSVPYEELRFKALMIEKQTGKTPTVGLICLGELKKHKARADFVTGFLAAGGIRAEKSSEIHDGQAAVRFIAANEEIKHFCICGDQRQYDESVQQLIKEILEKFPGIQLSMAGVPEETMKTSYHEAGIKEYWHVKSNNYQVLSSLLQEMEVSIHE